MQEIQEHWLAFLDQTPGAQLIFVANGRRISAFVFPKNKSLPRVLGGRDVSSRRATFQVGVCGKKQRRYLIVGDADAETIPQLADWMETNE